MKKITTNKQFYYNQFKDFYYFDNFIKFMLRDHEPTIHVNEEETCIVLYFAPCHFILGDPEEVDVNDVCSILPKGAWIVPSTPKWKDTLEGYFKEEINSYERVLFDSSQLDVKHIKSFQKPLPNGLNIIPLEERHTKSILIYNDVVSKYYTVSNFMDHGFGFVLVDESDFVHGFCLTNFPVIGTTPELYFRIGFEGEENLRGNGYGIILCSYFIEECLNRGYEPIWDAATPLSAHVATKLGFIPKDTWFMSHIKK